VLKHHFVGPSCFGISRTVGRRGHDNVGGAVGTIVGGRSRAGRDEDSGSGVGHIFDCGANLYEVIEWLSDGIVVVSANAEEVLLEAFVKGVEDGVGRGQFEERRGG